jgi:hypothetical protein
VSVPHTATGLLDDPVRPRAELRVIEINNGCRTVVCDVAGSYNRQGSLNISERVSGRSFGRKFSLIGPVADECAQHSDHSGLVTGRVLHDALQRVDAAEADVN